MIMKKACGCRPFLFVIAGGDSDTRHPDGYANLRSGSPMNQASMPSTIWL